MVSAAERRQEREPAAGCARRPADPLGGMTCGNRPGATPRGTLPGYESRSLIKQALDAGINFFGVANSTRRAPAKRSSAGPCTTSRSAASWSSPPRSATPCGRGRTRQDCPVRPPSPRSTPVSSGSGRTTSTSTRSTPSGRLPDQGAASHTCESSQLGAMGRSCPGAQVDEFPSARTPRTAGGGLEPLPPVRDLADQRDRPRPAVRPGVAGALRAAGGYLTRVIQMDGRDGCEVGLQVSRAGVLAGTRWSCRWWSGGCPSCG